MGTFSRATRGGVGAVLFAVAMVGVALTAGWASGASYDGWRSTGPCAGCSSSVDAAEITPAPRLSLTPTHTPQATATPEPDGFPYVSARSIAVVEGSCGALIYGRDEHRQLPPASLTKLMTAAIAIEQADLSMMITSDVDGSALRDATNSTVMGLVPGMELSLEDLLYGLLLPSGNDAAIVIARGVSGSEAAFVDLMNEKAQALALNDSNFTNPHGLDDPDLRSSAYDMAMLARFVMQNEDLRAIVQTKSWTPRWDLGEIWNGNDFINRYEGADGVKIGFTEESQQTIVASATRGGRRIVAALMRSQDRYTDAERLLDWAFAQNSACP